MPCFGSTFGLKKILLVDGCVRVDLSKRGKRHDGALEEWDSRQAWDFEPGIDFGTCLSDSDLRFSSCHELT